MPLHSISVQDSNATISTDAFISIWPFKWRNGSYRPNRYISPFFNNTGSQASADYVWPIRRMEVNMPGEMNDNYLTRLNKFQIQKEVPFYNIKTLFDFVSSNLQEILNRILRMNVSSNAYDVLVSTEFTPKNNTVALSVVNRKDIGVIPWNSSYFAETGTSVTQIPSIWTSYDLNGVQTLTFSEARGFSIIGNRVLRDLLPSLPWIEIDNSKLPAFRQGGTNGRGAQIPGWYEQTGENEFYYLDFSQANLDLETEKVKIIDVNHWDEYYKATEFVYNFVDVDLTSLINVSTFVVQMTGIDLTQQTYPINIVQSNNSSALTTQIPIIEVYYPVWQQISDMSTNLIVSKDIFTNAAPILLNHNAMYERNFSIIVGYITKSGKLKQLVIPPYSNLSVQITFAFIN